MTERKTIKKLVFSKWYKKLENDVFITLRRKPQCFAGEKVTVVIKGLPNVFYAKCLQLLKVSLNELSNDLLLFDTDAITRSEAIELIQSFYRKELKDDEVLILHIMEKIEDD